MNVNIKVSFNEISTIVLQQLISPANVSICKLALTKLPRISKRPILLISKIHIPTLTPTTTTTTNNNNPLPIPPPILPRTNNPPRADRHPKHNPRHNRRNNPTKIPRPPCPQLRPRNTPSTIPNKKHGISNAPLRIPFYIRRAQREENGPRCCYAGGEPGGGYYGPRGSWGEEEEEDAAC